MNVHAFVFSLIDEPRHLLSVYARAIVRDVSGAAIPLAGGHDASVCIQPWLAIHHPVTSSESHH